MTKNHKILIILIIFFISCKQSNYIRTTKNYFDDYAKKKYEDIMPYLSDSISIVDGDYKKTYSLEEFQQYYQWDSVFNPKSNILEISSIENNVLLTISTHSKRFEFLGNNPMITKQKVLYKENKIYEIEILESVNVDWNVWVNKRDSLVEWINVEHPDLVGFIYDMTKTGGEKYLKAISLYDSREQEE